MNPLRGGGAGSDGGEDWKPEGWLKRQGKGAFGKKFIKKYFVLGGGMLMQYKADVNATVGGGGVVCGVV